jgi:hypothetical protein
MIVFDIKRFFSRIIWSTIKVFHLVVSLTHDIFDYTRTNKARHNRQRSLLAPQTDIELGARASKEQFLTNFARARKARARLDQHHQWLYPNNCALSSFCG